MVTARSFAARNRYDIDVDQEFIALGACQIAAGLSQGFAVAGADSRTAVNDEMGGKTQMVGLIAAATMAAVLFFLTEPLRYLPVAALGAVLIIAAIGLFDVAALRKMWRVNRAECVLSLFTTVGVIWLDLLQGILLAVGSALLLLIKRASRPHDAVLGHVSGMRGWHDVADHQEATTHPGLMVYRFGAWDHVFQCGILQETGNGACRKPRRHRMDHRGWKHDQPRGHHRGGNARIPCRRTGRKGRPLRLGERTP